MLLVCQVGQGTGSVPPASWLVRPASKPARDLTAGACCPPNLQIYKLMLPHFHYT